MGSGAPRRIGAQPPSHVTYYVATAAIVGLLLLLCLYFCYYFVKRVKELSSQASPLQSPVPAQARPPPAPVLAPYPVQPGVRDSATAMVKLCTQLPAPGGGKGGGIVFPAPASPAAQHAEKTPPPP